MNDKNVKYWPTKKLKEVIDENYNRGVNGADFGVIIHEIKEVYQDRINKEAEKKLKEYENYINNKVA